MSSHHASRSGNAPVSLSALAVAARQVSGEQSGHESVPTRTTTHGPPSPRRQAPNRNQSWYQDALGQGMTEEELRAFLSPGEEGANNGSGTGVGGGLAGASCSFHCSRFHGSTVILDDFDDEEILEQYRMLAIHEARQQVMERLGVDVAELRESQERREQEEKEAAKELEKQNDLELPEMIPPPKPKLFKSRLPSTACSQRVVKPREPQLQVGQVMLVNNKKPDASLVMVQCLGCSARLLVRPSATLVQCPECKTVSPATSLSLSSSSSPSPPSREEPQEVPASA